MHCVVLMCNNFLHISFYLSFYGLSNWAQQWTVKKLLPIWRPWKINKSPLLKKQVNKLLPGGEDGQICWKERVVVDFYNISNHHIKPLNPEPVTFSQHFNFAVVDFIICSMSFLFQMYIIINRLESLQYTQQSTGSPYVSFAAWDSETS